MPSTFSPLRYPGGKTQLTEFILNLFKINDFDNIIYVEPFSGGAGISLKLLINGEVSSIIINDLDASIHSVWYSILNYPEELIALIESTEISLANWKSIKNEWKEINNQPKSLRNGFCTLYLNRTNRSGIIMGGPIGGLKQQGKYRIDCRFNKQTLIKKIRQIHSFKEQITLLNLDAKELLKLLASRKDVESYFFFLDPPYYKQGKNLYTNFFNHEDHLELYNVISNFKGLKWITTYDYEQSIKNIYKDEKSFEYEIRYSAQTKRIAKEYLFASEGMKIETFDKVIIHSVSN